MSTPLAPTMSLYMAGDSLLAAGAPGRPTNGSVGDLFAALNGMPVVNAAGGGWMMKDAALQAFSNYGTKWVGPKPGIVLLSAGANDAGQHQDARALDAFELSLRHFMHTTGAASRIGEQTAAWTKTGTWTNVASDLYGLGGRVWTATPGATRTVTFMGKEAVFTVWGFQDDKFVTPYTGGAAFTIHDENNVERASSSSSNRCYNSANFSATAGHLVPMPFHVVFDTYGTHTLKITHTGTSTQQLWVDDLMIPGSIKPLVFMPLLMYSHANFLIYGNPLLTDAVVDDFRARQEAVAADHQNLILVDMVHDMTDQMYWTDWYHFVTEGHEKMLSNFLDAVPSVTFSNSL